MTAYLILDTTPHPVVYTTEQLSSALLRASQPNRVLLLMVGDDYDLTHAESVMPDRRYWSLDEDCQRVAWPSCFVV